MLLQGVLPYNFALNYWSLSYKSHLCSEMEEKEEEDEEDHKNLSNTLITSTTIASNNLVDITLPPPVQMI